MKIMEIKDLWNFPKRIENGELNSKINSGSSIIFLVLVIVCLSYFAVNAEELLSRVAIIYFDILIFSETIAFIVTNIHKEKSRLNIIERIIMRWFVIMFIPIIFIISLLQRILYSLFLPFNLKNLAASIDDVLTIIPQFTMWTIYGMVLNFSSSLVKISYFSYNLFELAIFIFFCSLSDAFRRISYGSNKYHSYVYKMDYEKLKKFVLFIAILLNYMFDNKNGVFLFLALINSFDDVYIYTKRFNRTNDELTVLHEYLVAIEKCRNYLTEYKDNLQFTKIKFNISVSECMYYKCICKKKKICIAFDLIYSLIIENNTSKVYEDFDELDEKMITTLNAIANCIDTPF